MVSRDSAVQENSGLANARFESQECRSGRSDHASLPELRTIEVVRHEARRFKRTGLTSKISQLSSSRSTGILTGTCFTSRFFDSCQSSGFNEQTANTSPSASLLAVQAQLFTVQSWLLAQPYQSTEICPVDGFEVINDRPGSLARVALKGVWLVWLSQR